MIQTAQREGVDLNDLTIEAASTFTDIRAQEKFSVTTMNNTKKFAFLSLHMTNDSHLLKYQAIVEVDMEQELWQQENNQITCYSWD